MLLTGKIAGKVGCTISVRCDDILSKPFDKVFAFNNTVPPKERERIAQAIWDKVEDEVSNITHPILNQNIISIEATLHER